MDQPIEESSCGDDDSLSPDSAPITQLDPPRDAWSAAALGCERRTYSISSRGVLRVSVPPSWIFFLLHDQLRHLSLLDHEIRLALQNLAHLDAVLLLVELCAGRPHGRTT